MMFSIRYDRCTTCGQCSRVCPSGVFYMDPNGQPQIDPDKRCLNCMHCTAACPVCAIRHDHMAAETLYPAVSTEPLVALIQSRRAIRHFKPEVPKRSILEQALQDAASAPSGSNQRAHRMFVLFGKSQTDHAAQLALDYAKQTPLAPELKSLIGSGRNLLTCDAPCAILCAAPDSGNRGALDSAIALTTLELLLVQAGLGTCWGGYLARLSTNAPALRNWLGLLDGWQIYCTLLIGYPDQEAYPNIAPRVPVEARWFEA